MTAQEIYTGTVRLLDKPEQARLASLILENMEEADFPAARPDVFFTQEQILRLQNLMRLTQNGVITPDECVERDALIEAELLASARRTAALADAQGR